MKIEELIIKLKENNSKLENIDKEMNGVISNVTGDIDVRIKSYEKEMEKANSDRKRVIQNSIEIEKSNREENVKYFTNQYLERKKEVLKESLKIIMNTIKSSSEEIQKIINRDTKLLEKYKNLIIDKTAANDFETVSALSEKSSKLSQTLEVNKNLLNGLNSIENEVKDLLNNIDKKNIDDLNELINSYKGKLLKVEGSISNYTESEETLGKEKSESKDSNEEKNNIINEINYYFAIAKDKNSKEALDYATSLIKEVEDEEIRNDLEAEAALIATQIYENPEKVRLIKEAERLVEKAENTEKSEDFNHAHKAIKLIPGCAEKKELQRRLLEVCKNNKQRFEELMDKIYSVIADKKEIIKEDIDELSDRYQYLDDSYTSTIDDNYNRIIIAYNNQVQNDYQKGLTKKDIKKYSVADILREGFGGGIVNFIAGTKVAAKVNKNKLKKYTNKLANAKTDKKKAKYEKKIEKVNKSIFDKDVVSSVKLFIARNKLARKKPNLYKEGLNDSKFKKVKDDDSNSNKVLYQTKATNKISELLLKGLREKLEDESIAEDKSRVTTILDQLLELISSGTYDKNYAKSVLDYLNIVKDVIIKDENGNEKNLLSDSEYKGYYDEIRIIDEYRKNNNGMPYHMNNIDDKNEVDEIIKYYDSDAYNKAMKKVRYIKGK